MEKEYQAPELIEMGSVEEVMLNEQLTDTVDENDQS